MTAREKKAKLVEANLRHPDIIKELHKRRENLARMDEHYDLAIKGLRTLIHAALPSIHKKGLMVDSCVIEFTDAIHYTIRAACIDGTIDYGLLTDIEASIGYTSKEMSVSRFEPDEHYMLDMRNRILTANIDSVILDTKFTSYHELHVKEYVRIFDRTELALADVERKLKIVSSAEGFITYPFKPITTEAFITGDMLFLNHFQSVRDVVIKEVIL